MKLDGGCLCGKIRYRVNAQIIDAGYCHCRQCQRASGAPLIAWFTIAVAGFTYTSGQPAIFQSSVNCQREHCACCGTQLVFRNAVDPRTIDITVCSLDDSSAIKPQYLSG
jgi:hypothetical protein